MRKTAIIVTCLASCLLFSTQVLAKGGKNDCATIKDGTIEYGRVGDPNTEIIPIGYDQWGYNYQAHMFNGMWCDYHPYYRPGGAGHDDCIRDMGNVELMMKWSDEWLSNKDCNDDGKLDRGYSCDPDGANNSGCPGAWLTNHERGTYINAAGDVCSYYIFIKFIAAPDDAYVAEPYDEDGNGTWYTIDNIEIGVQIWGAFAVIQEVERDTCQGTHGATYISPFGTGLGKVKFIDN